MTDDIEYEMFTEAGNRRVATLINSVRTKASRGLLARGNLVPFIRGGMERIAVKHPEVYDTAVRESIYDELNALCDAMMWNQLEDGEL